MGEMTQKKMREDMADALMYLSMEGRELQREQEHLQAKIDAMKLEAMWANIRKHK